MENLEKDTLIQKIKDLEVILKEMDLKKYASQELRVNPEQVQIFTPTPSTYSTLMYYTEKDPFTNQKLFVEKDNGKKQKQKDIVTEKRNNNNYKKR